MSAYNQQEIRERLLNRLTDIGLQPLKHICKFTIRTVESATHLTVTSDDTPHAVHIAGTVGTLYSTELCIYVYDGRRPVGEGQARELTLQFQDAGYQTATIISLSSFTEDAKSYPTHINEISLRLISGDELVSIMVEEEIGITQSKDRYKFDPEFWSRFKKFDTDDLIPSRKVPQADSLELLVPVLQAVMQGHQTGPAIGAYLRGHTDLSLSDRQAHNYASAAELLGLLTADNQERKRITVTQWRPTTDGEQYFSRSNGNPRYVDREYLRTAVNELEISQAIESNFEFDATYTNDDLVEMLREESTITGETARRRATTLGKWFGTVQGKIRRTNRNPREYQLYPSGAIESY